MPPLNARLAGVELYFDDLAAAKQFYTTTLGLPIAEEVPEHHAKLNPAGGFLCLERKGAEPYPSAYKAVVFLEVGDLPSTLRRVDAPHVLATELTAARPWAAVRDPEGYTVLLLQAPA